MVNHLQNVFFVLDVVHVFALNDVVLLHRLQSKLLRFVFLQVSDLDVTKGAYIVQTG
jgi:hypothetical protein